MCSHIIIFCYFGWFTLHCGSIALFVHFYKRHLLLRSNSNQVFIVNFASVVFFTYEPLTFWKEVDMESMMINAIKYDIAINKCLKNSKARPVLSHWSVSPLYQKEYGLSVGSLCAESKHLLQVISLCGVLVNGRQTWAMGFDIVGPSAELWFFINTDEVTYVKQLRSSHY